MNTFFTESALALVVGIVCGAFVSEDGATVTAAALAASQALDPKLAFVSAFAGLWIGDLGIYALARRAGPPILRHRWFSRWLPSAKPKRQQTGVWSLAISRFFPGSRLPMYLSAGFERMPLISFATSTAISALLWTLFVFRLIHLAPAHASTLRFNLGWLSILGLTLFGIFTLWRFFGTRIRESIRRAFERVVRWEFWPSWIFYSPVALFCVWLGVRYRGFSLPTLANLNQKNGGIVGESKFEILRELMSVSPDRTAEAHLIEPAPLPQRLAKLSEICAVHDIEIPFVLKPDTAQRGAGFKKITSMDQAERYLAQVSSPVVLQRYVPGPKEAGISYYRFPGEARGHILGITRKEFPVIAGDGFQTLRELIRRDQRARFMERVYLQRFSQDADRVLPAGEHLRMVEAGNHCQGCEFRDGADLYSEELRVAIDQIGQKLNGFYVGRFDIRYESDEALRQGRGFQIIELNGAASEATHIYDCRNSIWSAYATLYHQWKLVYAIGAENRRRGFRPVSVFSVWLDWKEFASRARMFPIAD